MPWYFKMQNLIAEHQILSWLGWETTSQMLIWGCLVVRKRYHWNTISLSFSCFDGFISNTPAESNEWIRSLQQAPTIYHCWPLYTFNICYYTLLPYKPRSAVRNKFWTGFHRLNPLLIMNRWLIPPSQHQAGSFQRYLGFIICVYKVRIHRCLKFVYYIIKTWFEQQIIKWNPEINCYS